MSILVKTSIQRQHKKSIRKQKINKCPKVVIQSFIKYSYVVIHDSETLETATNLEAMCQPRHNGDMAEKPKKKFEIPIFCATPPYKLYIPWG